MGRGRNYLNDNTLRVLRALVKNARTSDNEISREIGISQVAVSKIRNKLEKKDVIKGYTVLMNFNMLDYKFGTIFLLLWNSNYWKNHKENEKIMFDVIDTMKKNLIFMNSLNSSQYDSIFIMVFKRFEEKRRILNIFKIGLGHFIEKLVDYDMPLPETPEHTGLEKDSSVVSFWNLADKVR